MTDLEVNEVEQGIPYIPTTWGPPLIHTFLTEEDFLELKEDVEIVRQENESFATHLAGRIETELLFNRELQYKWQAKLGRYIDLYLGAAQNRNNFNQGMVIYDEKMWEAWRQNMYLEAFWVNFQRKLEHNPPHNHSGHISFVIYLQVPQEIYEEPKKDTGVNHGFIEFTTHYNNNFALESEESKNPRNLAKALEYIQQDIGVTVFRPQERDILIFPSYLRHQVASFDSDVERISLSGNFKINSDAVLSEDVESKSYQRWFEAHSNE